VLGSKTFADVRCPLALTAVDLGQERCCPKSGELVEAVLCDRPLASSRWWAGEPVADGGVVIGRSSRSAPIGRLLGGDPLRPTGSPATAAFGLPTFARLGHVLAAGGSGSA
jgi:hypothetical protein